MLSQQIEALPQTQYETTPFQGGFDQISSGYTLPPGALRECVNFACRTMGGYYRIPGYERFDGRTKPSSAQYMTIAIILDPGKTIAVGQQGAFGNVNGTVCYVDPFGKYVGLTKTIAPFIDYRVSTFVPGPIVIGGDTKGQATGYYTDLNTKEFAQIKAAAANIYRADILPVPGSGPIRGVAWLNDVAYAFRDNAGGTAGDIYKSSLNGWVKMNLGSRVGFNGAGPLPLEGSTLTQGTVTATVRRVTITEGDPTANTAKGFLIITNPAGGNFASGAATFSPGATAINLTGAQTAITRLPGGRVTVSVGNFFSQESTERLYCADGVNDAFELDATTYTPIPVAGLSKKPKYAQVHSDHLFLAVASSVIHSAIGDPYNFEVLNGAGEIGTGGTITGLLVQPGDQGTAAMMVFARNSMWVLYGTDASTWKFVNFNVGIGAWDYTAQNLFEAFTFDDRGVVQLKQSLNYGNFDAGALTYNIGYFVAANRGKAVCSGVGRLNGQYRVFFNNGYGIYTTTNPSGTVGHGIVLFPDIPTCMYDSETEGGQGVQLFGTKDGYVMWNDLGTSFDGKPITAYMNTNINSAKSPRMRKRFRRCILELLGTAYVEMDVGYSFEWASPEIMPHLFENNGKSFSGVQYWDTFVWDAFFWDGRSQDAVSAELNGTGENIQLAIICDSDFIEQFTINSAIFHYTPRRGNR